MTSIFKWLLSKKEVWLYYRYELNTSTCKIIIQYWSIDFAVIIYQEKFEDTKGHKSKDRQYNIKRTKRHTIVNKALHRKLKIEQYEPHWKLKIEQYEPHWKPIEIIWLSMRWIQGLINPCIHRKWKSLTVLLYDIKSNLN